MTIHPSAIIEPGAKLGQNVTIGPFCYVADQVTIGDNCCLANHVTLLPYSAIGPNCHLHSNAVIGDVPQDVAFRDEPSYVHIGSDCHLREGVTVHRGTKAGSTTTIGDGCLLMAHSHVAHNAHIGDRVIIANGALIAGYAQVGERAFISGNCLVHQFARIGRLVMMAGGSATSRDVPPFCMTQPQSANTVMGLNSIGLRRAGISSADRLLLKKAFKILYKSDLLVPEALAQLGQEFDHPLVAEMCEFIQSSTRGVCFHVFDGSETAE